MEIKTNITKLLIFIVITGFGCKDIEKSVDASKVEPFILKKVWILGHSDDPQALNYFNLQDGAALFHINHGDKVKVFGDSLKIVLDSIVSSRFVEVACSGQNALYRAQAFIEPGDTISFEIKDKKIRFHGKNADLHNFYTILEEQTPVYHDKAYKNDLFQYKNSIDSVYNIKKAFFDNYIKENKIVSKNFIAIAKADLKQEYLFGLMIPKNIPTIYSDIYNVNMYRGDRDGIAQIVKDEFSYGEKLFDAQKYFNNVNLDDFKDATLLENGRYFKMNVNQFIRYYFNPSTAEPFSKEGLLSEKNFIEKNFEGKMKNFAIARLIRDYEKKGFGYSINNITVLKSVMKEYEKEFTDPSYKDEMARINNSLDAFNFKLPDAALNSTKLLSLSGDTLTLNAIFKRSTKRIRIIDFWASWCPPCINEIKREKDFKDKLAIEKDVEWIYLSIDKDQDKWRKASNDLGKFLNVRNQYLILGGKNTSLGKALNVNFIPRYVVFNKKNEIVLENATLPSDTLMFKKVINQISLKE